MSALRLLQTTARRAPAVLGRRGYAEAVSAEKLKLSLVLPHQVRGRFLALRRRGTEHQLLQPPSLLHWNFAGDLLLNRRDASKLAGGDG